MAALQKSPKQNIIMSSASRWNLFEIFFITSQEHFVGLSHWFKCGLSLNSNILVGFQKAKTTANQNECFGWYIPLLVL